MALALDIDTVQAMLGGWLDRPIEAGLAARTLAIEMARTHLRAGHEVIVPQYLGRVDFINQLDQLCVDVGVPFIETALTADPAEVQARFTRRSETATTASHRAAAILQQRDGGVTALADTVARIELVIATRPHTRRIRSIDGEIEATYRTLLAQLDR